VNGHVTTAALDRRVGAQRARRILTSAFLTGALAAAGVVLAAGQQDALPTVFTAEQASAGKSAYSKACASCHLPDLAGNNDAPPLAGATFLSSWGARSTKELFDYMSATMPPNGGVLDPDAYLTIAAYVLQSNGAVAGAQPYTPDTAVRIGTLLSSRAGPTD